MKTLICKLFAHFLYRGMKVLCKKDERVKSEIDEMPEGICFALKYGLGENAPFTAIEKSDKGLKKRKELREGDIVITFKSASLALPVMTGCKGLSKAYCQHDFILSGSINETMRFVRIVELVLAHLLPRFMLKKTLRSVPDRSISIFKTYILALFGN